MNGTILFTCEHGGNDIPAGYEQLFRTCGRILHSHRGVDRGALELARLLSTSINAPLVHATVTRLLVDLNRSIDNAELFSRYTRHLALDARETILLQHYRPYREQVEKWVEQTLSIHASVMHFSIHSFTPVRCGEVRQADIGLLYDPARTREKAVCEAWRRQLIKLRPDLRVRDNYPYLGTADGFTTHLRSRFGENYLGIELEINQRWPRSRPTGWKKLQGDVLKSLHAVLVSVGSSDRRRKRS